MPVLGSLRDNKPDPAAWISNVPLVARNDVDVKLGDRLARGLSVIQPDVEAIRLRIERTLKVGQAPINPMGDPKLLFSGEFVEARDRALRNYETVT